MIIPLGHLYLAFVYFKNIAADLGITDFQMIRDAYDHHLTLRGIRNGQPVTHRLEPGNPEHITHGMMEDALREMAGLPPRDIPHIPA